MSKDLSRHCTNEDTQVANKHMERSSIPYGTRELQIRMTMRYHYIPLRIAKIQKIGSHEMLERKCSNRNVIPCGNANGTAVCHFLIKSNMLLPRD